MKPLLSFLFLVLLKATCLSAQSGVASQYLTNAGFDTETDFVKSHVYTYAKDAQVDGGISSCQPVTGWVPDATGDAKAGGAFRYGSDLGLAGSTYIVPAVGPDTNTSGGALGLASCWTNAVGYYQNLTLPAGRYLISYKVYNAGTNMTDNYESTFGFVEQNGTTHYDNLKYPSGVWTNGVIRLLLNSATSGKIHLGYNSGNVGSASTPKLFVDEVKVESYDDLIASLRYIVGDVNNDKQLNISDVVALVNIILNPNTYFNPLLANVNAEGGIDVADVVALVNNILSGLTPSVVDNTYQYADIDAMVYARQQAAENAESSGYMVKSAVCSLTDENVTSHYTNLDPWLTRLNISTGSLTNVESVSVYAIDKSPIAGPVTIMRQGNDASFIYSEGDELTYATNQQSDVVTVQGNDAGTYIAYLLPVPLAKGVMVTVRTSDGKFYSQTFTNIQVGKANDLSFTSTTASNLWMSTIPGNTYFSLLSTPGAHDAATSNTASYAKCQTEDIAGLLANGVRAFDLRPRYTSNSVSDIQLDNLEIYHGSVATGVKFKDAIDILINFVKNNPSEAVSVIMQKESSGSTDQSETWRASIRECFSDASRSPYIMGDVRGFHTLDDVRGKLSIVSKNPYGNSNNGYRDVVYGAIIENWPDDGVVTNYSCDMTQAGNWTECRASVEDAYNSNTSTKTTQVQTQLQLASSNTDRYRYCYTFTSIAYSLFGSSITSSAKKMNPATVNIIANLQGPLCYVYGDFMGSNNNGGSSLLNAIIQQNYKYVYTGKTR